MDIGIGLPNAVKGTRGDQIVEFARKADERGFSTLGTIDRVVYDSYDPFAALAAAGAVTDRIKLATTVCIAPPHHNAVVLAKRALSVQALSGGRFRFMIGLGARDDDYESGGVPTSGKGKRLTSMLEAVEKVFAGDEFGFAGAVGPRAEEPPPIVVGGSVEASFERAARFGEGWIMGGGTPEMFAQAAEGVRSAWSEAGRDGDPYLGSLAYYSLGPDGEENAQENIGDYYAFLGEEGRQMVAGSAATSEEMVRQYLSAFEDAGCRELILFPGSADPQQVDLLADAAGL